MNAAQKNTRRVAGSVSDATLPKTPVMVGGTEYNLCFDLGALAEAETAINGELARAGSAERVNLLFELPQQTLASTRNVFAAAVRVFRPDLSFAAARRLLGFPDLYPVAMAVRAAWEASRVEDKGANPIEAAAVEK